MSVSIIIPVLNEAGSIKELLQQLITFRNAGHQIILVDGGSSDNTVEIAAPYVDDIVKSPKGRSLQMNAGAAKADGEVLWFVHADSLLPDSVVSALFLFAIPSGLLLSGTSRIPVY